MNVVARNTEPNPAKLAIKPKAGLPKAKRHVEKDGVGADREAAALRRSTPHGLDAEAWIDQNGRKAANGVKRGANRRSDCKGGEHRHSDAERGWNPVWLPFSAFAVSLVMARFSRDTHADSRQGPDFGSAKETHCIAHA